MRNYDRIRMIACALLYVVAVNLPTVIVAADDVPDSEVAKTCERNENIPLVPLEVLEK